MAAMFIVFWVSWDCVKTKIRQSVATAVVILGSHEDITQRQMEVK